MLDQELVVGEGLVGVAEREDVGGVVPAFQSARGFDRICMWGSMGTHVGLAYTCGRQIHSKDQGSRWGWAKLNLGRCGMQLGRRHARCEKLVRTWGRRRLGVGEE